MQNKNSKILALQSKKIPPQAIDFEEGVLGALMLIKMPQELQLKYLVQNAFIKKSIKKFFKFY